MTDEAKWDLLADLAKLLKKHGPDAFAELSMTLTNREFTRQLAALLPVIGTRGREAEMTRRPRRKTQPRVTAVSFLEDLKTQEPERHALLYKFYEEYVAETILLRLADVRRFAKDSGLHNFRSDSRRKAALPLLKALATVPLEVLRTQLSTVHHFSSSDRDLEGWSKLILDKERRPKER